MASGITFESNGIKKHTFEDWGLFLSSFSIGEATPKTEYVDIVGGNGTLDLTEIYDHIFYKDRTHTIVLTSLDDELRFTSKLDEITAFLHGRKFNITTDFNSDWYYVGRVEVNKYATSKRLGQITLKCVCEPFKYKRYKTYVSEIVNGTDIEVVCPNSRMEVVPTFRANTNMTFEYNGATYTLTDDDTIYNDIFFTEGNNILKVTGNGTITISYQEGTL